MKLKINSQGGLEIERAGKMKVQFCPFAERLLRLDRNNYNREMIHARACGDWCPMFSEPMELIDGYIALNLCNDKNFSIMIQDFTDERK